MAYFGASSGSSAIDIGVAITLHDRFTNPAQNISSQMRNLYGEANRNLNAMKQQAQEMWQTSSNIVRGVVQAMDSTMEYHDNMVLVKAITGATAEEMVHLGNVTQTLAKDTMFGAGQVADGMKMLSQAGFELAEIPTLIENAAKLANATGIELGGVLGGADIMASVSHMFQKNSVGEIAAAADQLAMASFASNVNMQDLAQSLKYAGSTMNQLHIPLTKTLALIGTLGNAGIKGSSAGVYLENLARFLNQALYKPSSAGGKALAQLGLSREDLVDAEGNLLDLGHVVGLISKKIEEMGGSTSNSLLMNQMFGDLFKVRGNRAAQALVQNLGDYREILAKIEKSNGVVAKTSEMRMKNLSGQWDTVTSNLENILVTITENLAEPLTHVLSVINRVLEGVRALADTWIGRVLIIGAAIKPLKLIIKSGYTMLRYKLTEAMNYVKGSALNTTQAVTSGWGRATSSVHNYRMALRKTILEQQMLEARNAVYASQVMKRDVANKMMLRLQMGQNFKMGALHYHYNKSTQQYESWGNVYDAKTRKVVGMNKVASYTPAQFSDMIAGMSGRLGAGRAGTNTASMKGLNDSFNMANKTLGLQSAMLVNMNRQLASINKNVAIIKYSSVGGLLKGGLKNNLKAVGTWFAGSKLSKAFTKVGGWFKGGSRIATAKKIVEGRQVVAAGGGIGKVLQKFGLRFLGKSALKWLGRGLATVLGGPVGILITVATFIPDIVRWIKRRKDGSKEDADTVADAAKQSADKISAAADKVVAEHQKNKYKPNPQLQQVIDLLYTMYNNGTFKPVVNVAIPPASQGQLVPSPLIDQNMKLGLK